MKTKFKGTLGKWTNSGLTIMTEENKKIVGGCHLMTFEHDTRGRLLPDTIGLANAKLIATAPELLKAIEGFISDFEGDYVMDDGRIVYNPSNILIANYEIMKKVLEKALTQSCY